MDWIFYAIFTTITLILCWTIILINYVKVERFLDDTLEVYPIHGLIPYLFWTLTLTLFTIGVYYIPDPYYLKDTIYFSVLIINIYAIFTLYVLRDLITTHVIYIFQLALIIFAMASYTDIALNSSWFILGLLIWTAYMIQSTYHHYLYKLAY